MIRIETLSAEQFDDQRIVCINEIREPGSVRADDDFGIREQFDLLFDGELFERVCLESQSLKSVAHALLVYDLSFGCVSPRNIDTGTLPWTIDGIQHLVPEPSGMFDDRFWL
ncbi:hypothetical protein OB955_09640 [Halobacteria archaeon AArc-m2/3/4]|uniref:Uncharacterized protein n=1 Tax=Natronoglomus mannanivorans TaxID=2979990 RepID=A0ABT2QDJ6_9EURY|nr:hypothetical protein [Halobacteria archaeon AArc-m2/3/4]